MCNEETVVKPVSDWTYSRLCILQQVIELGYDAHDWAEKDTLFNLCHDVVDAFLLGIGTDKNIKEIFNLNTDN